MEASADKPSGSISGPAGEAAPRDHARDHRRPLDMPRTPTCWGPDAGCPQVFVVRRDDVLTRGRRSVYRILWLHHRGNHEMEWAEETIVRLRTLWDEGLSTAEIGRRLGVSKNAVVGKAHRLDLPARPSPIRRDGGSGRCTAAVRAAPRGRSDAAAAFQYRAADGVASARARTADGARMAPMAARSRRRCAPVARVAPPAPRPYGRIVTCCWPIGEPGTRSFRFCDDASEPGKPGLRGAREAGLREGARSSRGRGLTP